jgi:hypothetical protein
MLTLTVLGDGDRVPRVERVKCVLKGARINDLFDTGGLVRIRGCVSFRCLPILQPILPLQ